MKSKSALEKIYHAFCPTRYSLLVLIWLILLVGSAAAQRVILKDAATPIAEQPTPQSRVIAVLAKGDSVRVLKFNGVWAQVVFRGKQKGWMYVGRKAAAAKTPTPATAPSPSAKPTNTAPAEEIKPVEQTPIGNPAMTTTPPVTDGGISFHLGSFSQQFTYVGKFYYRTLPTLYVEGTFQYVAGNVASNYLMYGNAKYVRPLGRRIEGTLTAGVGVINTVPVSAAGSRSVSNMVFNYGLGVQRYLKNSNWLRADLREYTALRQKGLTNFFEFSVGIAIGISWSKI